MKILKGEVIKVGAYPLKEEDSYGNTHRHSLMINDKNEGEVWVNYSNSQVDYFSVKKGDKVLNLGAGSIVELVVDEDEYKGNIIYKGKKSMINVEKYVKGEKYEPLTQSSSGGDSKPSGGSNNNFEFQRGFGNAVNVASAMTGDEGGGDPRQVLRDALELYPLIQKCGTDLCKKYSERTEGDIRAKLGDALKRVAPVCSTHSELLESAIQWVEMQIKAEDHYMKSQKPVEKKAPVQTKAKKEEPLVGTEEEKPKRKGRPPKQTTVKKEEKVDIFDEDEVELPPVEVYQDDPEAQGNFGDGEFDDEFDDDIPF